MRDSELRKSDRGSAREQAQQSQVLIPILQVPEEQKQVYTSAAAGDHDFEECCEECPFLRDKRAQQQIVTTSQFTYIEPSQRQNKEAALDEEINTAVQAQNESLEKETN